MNNNYFGKLENSVEDLFELIKQIKENNKKLKNENLELEKLSQDDKNTINNLLKENGELKKSIQKGGINKEKEEKLRLSISKILKKMDELQLNM